MGAPVIPRTRDNRNRNLTGDVPPPLPAMELREIVRAHQPDEAVIRIEPGQFGERVGGVARLHPLLDRGGADRCMPRHRPRRGHARLERRHAGLVLQRIAGRDHPPHFVEIERAQGMQRQPPMPSMRRIERASQKSDAFQRVTSQSLRSWRMRRISSFSPFSRYTITYGVSNARRIRTFLSPGRPRCGNSIRNSARSLSFASLRRAKSGDRCSESHVSIAWRSPIAGVVQTSSRIVAGAARSSHRVPPLLARGEPRLLDRQRRYLPG